MFSIISIWDSEYLKKSAPHHNFFFLWKCTPSNSTPKKNYNRESTFLNTPNLIFFFLIRLRNKATITQSNGIRVMNYLGVIRFYLASFVETRRLDMCLQKLCRYWRQLYSWRTRPCPRRASIPAEHSCTFGLLKSVQSW